jgi:hypothetical protein
LRINFLFSPYYSALCYPTGNSRFFPQLAVIITF